MKRWLNGKEWAIIIVLIILSFSVTVAMVVYNLTLTSMINDGTAEPQTKINKTDDNKKQINDNEVKDDNTEEETIEEENTQDDVDKEDKQVDDEFEVIDEESFDEEYVNEEETIACTYCRKEISSNDDNRICNECEEESWSWHCTHCDNILTQSEYDNDTGMCVNCTQKQQEMVDNSPYGICDLCGKSIEEMSEGVFVENDKDFCSRICQDKFANRTSLYGYCEVCTKQLSYSEYSVFKTKCEICVNKEN